MPNLKICSVENCGRRYYAKSFCRSHYYRLRSRGVGTRHGEPLRFIRDVVLNHEGPECLAWPFGGTSRGYGTVRVDGKMVVASRYVCELAHGAPPTPEHDAAHSCGKGHEGCVAPGHLEWKTHAGNMADMLVHGTHQRGERHARAKLNEAAVREILALRGKETQINLAKRFGVSQQTVANIYSGRNWSWLSEEGIAA